MLNIVNDNYVCVAGWMVNDLHLTMPDLFVYAIVAGFPQGYNQPIAYIMQWTGITREKVVRKCLQRLTENGLLTAEVRAGKTTVYHATQRGSNMTGVKYDGGHKQPPTPVKNDPPIYNIYNNISSSTTPRERLSEWVNTSDLQDWAQRLLHRAGWTIDIEQVLSTFYDNDFRVRERCERSERGEVLQHFQNWLPKYITKQQQNNDNNNSTSGTSSRDDTKPYQRIQQLIECDIKLQ